jgi:hypothetical protein
MKEGSSVENVRKCLDFEVISLNFNSYHFCQEL